MSFIFPAGTQANSAFVPFKPTLAAAPTGGGFNFAAGVGANQAAAKPSFAFSPAGPPTAASNFSFGLAAGKPTVASTLSENSIYSSLSLEQKKTIDDTFSEFKEPMTNFIKNVGETDINKDHDDIAIALRKIKVSVLKLSSQQERLLKEVKLFKDEAKQHSDDARRFGLSECNINQHNKVVFGDSTGQHRTGGALPNDFFIRALKQLESRLNTCVREIDHFDQQLSLSIRAAENARGGGLTTGSYGQKVHIGSSQLVQVIQHQNEAFMRIAALIAETHREADEMRVAFTRLHHPHHPSIFEEEDKKEEAEKKKKERLLREKLQREREKKINSESTGVITAGAGGGNGLFPAASFSFSAPATTTTPAGPIAFAPFSSLAPAAAKPTTAAASTFGAPTSTPANPFSFSSTAASATTSGFGGFGSTTAPAFGQPAATGGAAAAATTGAFVFNSPAGDLAGK